MKNLPLGIQSFQQLHKMNCIYVDKTKLIHQLVTRGKYYFLSRPRRFGKSLLLSTLQCLFEGKRDLFKDLWIENHWDWSNTSPVLHISFTNVDYEEVPLSKGIHLELDLIAQSKGIQYPASATTYKLKFRALIQALFQQSGPVVLLIDEYDKPIIDYLEHENLKQARKNRDILKTFYSCLKNLDDCLQLVFITGVSKFTRTSIFSDLNNLTDLTLRNDYATLLGYTQAELEFYFKDYLQNAQNQYKITRKVLLEKIKLRYDGYSWDGVNHLYNPYGTLNFLDSRQFDNFWFSTGTPTFLIKLMKRHQVFDVENIVVDKLFLEKYDLDNLNIISLLFQAGYLTIQQLEEEAIRLDYPNLEVRESMYKCLLKEFNPMLAFSQTGLTTNDLKAAFETNNLTRVRTIIDAMLSDLPYQVYDATHEGLYHGLIHILFKNLGLAMRSEVHSSRGRADVVVETDTVIFIFEFKVKGSSTLAFKQIIDNNYAGKYRASNKTITGIGVKFDTQNKICEEWHIENL